MRVDGTLSKWDDDRGFGFIAGTLGGDDIFVHISVFPKDGQHPKVGEHITFEVEIDPKGKKRAKNLVCMDRSTTHRSRQAERVERRPVLSYEDKPSWFRRFVPLVIFVALGAYAYNKYNTHLVPQMAVSAPSSEQSRAPSFQSSTASFQCDGRKHCSQMTSCAEAKYFLSNCPGVKMDGDHDGIPCEDQLCR